MGFVGLLAFKRHFAYFEHSIAILLASGQYFSTTGHKYRPHWPP